MREREAEFTMYRIIKKKDLTLEGLIAKLDSLVRANGESNKIAVEVIVRYLSGLRLLEPEGQSWDDDHASRVKPVREEDQIDWDSLIDCK
jgi:hypothetical protein